MMKRIGSFIAALSSAALAVVPVMQALPVKAGGYLRPTIEMLVPMTENQVTDSQSPEKTAVLSTSPTPGDPLSYGENEDFSIVPCNTGGGAVDDSGAGKIHLWKAHRKANQRWKIKRSGEYVYFQESSGKVIEIPGNGGNGTQLVPAAYNGGDGQLWRIQDMGDGTFTIHSKRNDSLVWDVSSYAQDNGTAICVYGCHGDRNQRFTFVPLTTQEPMSEWGASRHDCNGSDWSIWDGSLSYDWYYKDQNARDMYINSAADLYGFTSLVVNGWNFNGKTVHLTCDINLAGIEWTPIGNKDHMFHGSFNGEGHSIVGLSITQKNDFQGLFGVVQGGSIGNFAIKGSVSGDDHVGGVVGWFAEGHLYDIYSEVTLTKATDQYEGGIAGYNSYGGYIEHCTQNARINSSDKDPCRGGIAGRNRGVIRWCVNEQTVDCNWNYCGGITGQNLDGKIEFCVNHGMVGGGGDTELAGGIAGETNADSVIYGCFNDGFVYSSNDDYIGGICGDNNGGLVACCINNGKVQGDDHVGGILGDSNCYCCYNGGYVLGDDQCGAITGDTAGELNWCRALAWTSPYLNGTHDSNNAEWIGTADIINGKCCYDLNVQSGQIVLGSYSIPTDAVFFQNIGSDPIPTFAGAKVTQNGNTYVNEEYVVSVDAQKGYGTVEGTGAYKSGTVTLKAQPADGCVFDHFEVTTSTALSDGDMYGGTHDRPGVTTKTYTDAELKLTGGIDRSYRVKAVFTVFDDVPEDLHQRVKVEIECANDTDGWNSDIVPVYLEDSAGEKHLWEISRADIDGDNLKVSKEFDLGAASPVAVYAYPDFGGGFTFHDLGLKARIWVNGSPTAMESEKVMIRSYPFISSKWNNDYMSITFAGYGNATVGITKADGSFESKGTYTKCKDAWDAAKALGEGATIRLDGAWLADSLYELESGKAVTLDLNGFPIIRTLKKTTKKGGIFKVSGTLTVTDSTPERSSASSFSGGSIQGGRSDDAAGLVYVDGGTFVMQGGTLYNGGTDSWGGGAVWAKNNANVSLSDVLIASCWADGAWTHNNYGGAVYVQNATVSMKNVDIRNCHAEDHGGAVMAEDQGKLMLENVHFSNCRADENQGGAIYMEDDAEVTYIGGSIKSCSALEDNGGAIYQEDGKLYCENVEFLNNYSEDHGGAVYINTDDATWLIGCTFRSNTADDDGGAIYMDNDKLYMESCTVTNNASKGIGGGLFISCDGSIDLCGKAIIKDNDGEDYYDNLTLGAAVEQTKTYFAQVYDAGLRPGSEVHVFVNRIGADTDHYITAPSVKIDEHQMQYFHADHGWLDLTDTEEAHDTNLMASAFTDGRWSLILGLTIIPIVLCLAMLLHSPKRKGGE